MADQSQREERLGEEQDDRQKPKSLRQLHECPHDLQREDRCETAEDEGDVQRQRVVAPDQPHDGADEDRREQDLDQ